MRNKILSFLLIFLFSIPAFSQVLETKKAPSYTPGYWEYKLTDSSRTYKPGAVNGTPLFFRPVEIDVWYPATTVTNHSPLDYSYFISLLERRANSFQDSVKYEGLTNELSRHFTIENTSSGKTVKTKSHLDIPPIKGSFPLIIYFSAFNGMSYENVPLFENLASHGYVVVSISSIGRYPGNMTTRFPDVMEQVADAEFALRFLGNKGTDTTKVGILSYSYGGVAAILMAQKYPAIKSILSLDGSEKHYYGGDKAEDKDFNDLRNSIYWKPSALKKTYAYLESDHKTDDLSVDSTYTPLPGGSYIYALINGASHEDFSSISTPIVRPGSAYELMNQLTLSFFDQTLKINGQPFSDQLLSSAKAARMSLSPKNIKRKSGQIILTGNVVAGANEAPLPYASIGIPSGNQGTVADYNGHFTLNLADTMMERRVRISALGYQSRTYTVASLLAALAIKPAIRL
ncbi:carboxypeptidase-like regulatory domain-containing protein, partial [Pedobacter sp.]|uniref:carboxypeptidase-like regulatory domain-containing protein n=1 Tax=Pedobacter sp. TaxID=1411316 RepID=UPI002CB97A5B